jgi:DNA-binding FadR family transcriptional regulator
VPFEPVQRTSVSDAAFEQLLAAVLRGELAAGEQLPPERTLATTLGVNRQAVREAVKRLEQAGLVEVRHGGGTTVLDLRTSAGLDVLALVVRVGGVREPELARGALEMRRAIGADAAGLCAQRARPEHLVGLRATLDAQAAASPDDVAHLGELDWTFWTHVVDGADNLAYRLAFNSLRQSAAPLGDLLSWATGDEWRDVDAHRDLVHAIEQRDSARAEHVARTLLSGSIARVAEMLLGADATTPRRKGARR